MYVPTMIRMQRGSTAAREGGKGHNQQNLSALIDLYLLPSIGAANGVAFPKDKVALVGSIGVFAAHEDLSRALDAEGVTVSMISAGKYKVEGHPYGPLDPEAEAAAAKAAAIADCEARLAAAPARRRPTLLRFVRTPAFAAGPSTDSISTPPLSGRKR